MPDDTRSHFTPDLAHPQTLVWRNRQVDYRKCLGKNDAPTEDLCATIRAILDGTVPPTTSSYPPLRVRPFAWYIFTANTGYALALCGSLLSIWTICIAAFANLVILALPWQWQAEFSVSPPDAPPLMQEKSRA